MSDFAYKLVIQYPEGSQEPGWEPAGFEAESQLGLYDAPEWDAFRWPRERRFLSLAGARQRADQLRKWGAEVTIVTSMPIDWGLDMAGAQ